MKTALSRMLKLFVGHQRSKETNPTHRSYCFCGALNPDGGERRSEVFVKTEVGVEGMVQQRNRRRSR
jgi:hypothetical protein